MPVPCPRESHGTLLLCLLSLLLSSKDHCARLQERQVQTHNMNSNYRVFKRLEEDSNWDCSTQTQHPFWSYSWKGTPSEGPVL